MDLLAFRIRRRTESAIAVACLTLLFCSPAQAGRTAHRTVKHRPATVSPTKAATTPTAVVSPIPLGAAGMVAAVDPETGALVPPTAEQVRSLAAAERTGLMRTSAGLTEVRLPNGAVMMDLQGRFMEYSLVQLDRAGCPHFLCVNDEIMLRALLARYAPAPTPACEER